MQIGVKNLDEENKIKSGILESIVVIGIMSVYIAYGVYFLPLLIFLIPVAYIVLGIRNGIKYNVVSLLITLAIVQILLSSSSGATLLIAFGPLTLTLNYLIKSRKTKAQTVLISTASFLIPFVIIILLGGEIANVDLVKEAEIVFNQEFIVAQLEALEEMGLTNHEILQAKYAFEGAFNELLVLIPSLIMIFSLAIAYINYAFSTYAIRKMGYGTAPGGKLSRFKLPNNIILGVAIMMLTGYAFRLLEINYHEAFLLNVTFLVLVMFLIQGLAVVDFFLRKTKLNTFFRVIILILIVLIIPIGSILFFIGMFDSLFDIRKMRRKIS